MADSLQHLCLLLGTLIPSSFPLTRVFGDLRLSSTQGHDQASLGLAYLQNRFLIQKG